MARKMPDFSPTHGISDAAERMRRMRERRRRQGLRQLRLDVPNPHSPAVRKRIAEQVARLDPKAEEEAMDWIEQVGEFFGH
jgi:hypothetical protein